MRGLTRRAGSLQPAPPLPRQCTVVPWVRLAVGGWRGVWLAGACSGALALAFALMCWRLGRRQWVCPVLHNDLTALWTERLRIRARTALPRNDTRLLLVGSLRECFLCLLVSSFDEMLS